MCLVQEGQRKETFVRSCEMDPYLGLYHGWPLSAQGFDGLEQIHHSLISHPLQYNTQCDEHSCTTHAGTAEYEYTSVSQYTHLLAQLVQQLQIRTHTYTHLQ